MAASKKTALSAGLIIRAILQENPEVSGRVKRIYPVVSPIELARLPYIAYRRVSLTPAPTKAEKPAPDTVQIEILCHTKDYDTGVELAEIVRDTLDYVEAEHNGMIIRGCELADSSEDYENDAWIQQLIFNIKM